MKHKLRVGVAVLSLVALSACDEQNTTVNRGPDQRVATAPAQPAPDNTVSATTTKDSNGIANNGKAELTGETRAYVEKAAMGDLFEVESSKVALSRSQSQEIKGFAQHMVDEHTKTSDELKARLIRAGLIVELPTMLDDEHKKKIDDLRGSNAQQFDTRYIALQKEGHEQALMLHRDYAMNGTAADLKALAADIVPKVNMHIQMLNDLEKEHRTRLSKAESR